VNGTAGRARLLRPGAVYAWLAVLTALELGAVRASIGRGATVALLLGSAAAKAALVALFFMHLRVERRLLHAIVVAPLVLLALFLLALIPDIGRVHLG
jgi:cytochrome c oxidase subunit 4